MPMVRADYMAGIAMRDARLGNARLIFCATCRAWFPFEPKAEAVHCPGCNRVSDEAAELLRAVAERRRPKRRARQYRQFLGKELTRHKRRRKVKPPPLAQEQASSSPRREAQTSAEADGA